MSKESRPIDGMTPDEWIIYGMGYTRGLEAGEAIAEERIIELLEDNGLTAASELIKRNELAVKSKSVARRLDIEGKNK